MKRKLIGLLLGSALFLTACGGEDSPVVDLSTIEVTLTTEETKSIYSQNCASCHGQILANGLPGDLEGIASELSREELEKVIQRGTGMMPGGLVQGEEAAAIVQWLMTME